MHIMVKKDVKGIMEESDLRQDYKKQCKIQLDSLENAKLLYNLSSCWAVLIIHILKSSYYHLIPLISYDVCSRIQSCNHTLVIHPY